MSEDFDQGLDAVDPKIFLSSSLIITKICLLCVIPYGRMWEVSKNLGAQAVINAMGQAQAPAPIWAPRLQ